MCRCFATNDGEKFAFPTTVLHFEHRFVRRALRDTILPQFERERNTMRFVTIAGLLIFFSVPLFAIAPTPSPAPPAKAITDLQACRGISDVTERANCYDRAVDALSAATLKGDVVVVERGEVRKARKGLFGFTLPRIGFLTGKADNAEDVADEKELKTTVVSARSIGNGKWRFAVEGGGLWETVEANTGFTDPKPGVRVKIEKGIMGAYFVTVEKGRRVQAKRIG